MFPSLTYFDCVLVPPTDDSFQASVLVKGSDFWIKDKICKDSALKNLCYICCVLFTELFTLSFQGGNIVPIPHLAVCMKMTEVHWGDSFIPPLILSGSSWPLLCVSMFFLSPRAGRGLPAPTAYTLLCTPAAHQLGSLLCTPTAVISRSFPPLLASSSFHLLW